MLRAIFSGPKGKETLTIALASGAAYWVTIANTKRIYRAEEELRHELRLKEWQDIVTKSGFQIPEK